MNLTLVCFFCIFIFSLVMYFHKSVNIIFDGQWPFASSFPFNRKWNDDCGRAMIYIFRMRFALLQYRSTLTNIYKWVLRIWNSYFDFILQCTPYSLSVCLSLFRTLNEVNVHRKKKYDDTQKAHKKRKKRRTLEKNYFAESSVYFDLAFFTLKFFASSVFAGFSF